MIRLLFLPTDWGISNGCVYAQSTLFVDKPILSLLMDRRRRLYCVKNIRNHMGVFTQRPMEGKPGEANKSQVQADDGKTFDSVLTTSEE